jgi:outer membrane lipoprotein-sorting protein
MNSRKFWAKISIAAAFLPPLSVFAEPHPEVAAVVSRMRGMTGFRANISISSSGGALRGVLSFSGGKTHLALSDGRIIASTGRELVVYNPSSGVAGKQLMVPGGGGLGWLLTGFRTRVSGNTAQLEAESPTSNIQEVRLRWKEGHVLEQLNIKNKNSNDWLSITLSNVRAVDGFPVSLFSYDPPAGSRTVENPLNQSN